MAVSGASAAQQQSFVSTWSPYAQAAGNSLGVSPTSILAQWALESGWGTAPAAANNNVAGLGPGYSYASPQAFEGAYVSTIANNYPGAENAGADLSAFVSGLSQGPGGTPYFGNFNAVTNPVTPVSYQTSLGGVVNTLESLGVQPSVPAPVTTADAGGTAAPGAATGTPATAAPSSTAQAGATGGCSGLSGFFTWACWQGLATDLAFIAIGVLIFIVAVGVGLFGSHEAAQVRRQA